MKIIMIDEEAFFELFERVIKHVEENNAQQKKTWLTTPETLKALNITSKTTLQKYRDEGKIRFTQISRKVILYDASSVEDFLQQHAQETF
ncbi:DNA-binding protein [Flavobacterium arcticum]|uniref:DNA-binding protein n=1 Tax=Flavobacterium arcticum TaxID=1784713 RepID=A0A345H8R2_9FLAO|nr:helix-turn-helix domain-containing protein [Flavobacterium arcticum]AXG72972.1 DNA-binding protein [Flavobacterium arcticum]KAF2510364.1 helix-turn-helix domain-containing protein [Flavobacterium arcticum]